ncbi:MAG TPA: ferredoxin reductase [Fontimonas sp.]
MTTAATVGPLGRLLEPFIAPEVFDFWAAKLNPAWSWARSLARVVERRIEARDAVTLVLKPNRHFRGFRPGQHVNVSAEVNGSRVTRSYSLTDVPRKDRRIALTVKRVEGGKLSEHLCQRVAVGDVLELGPAFGDMTWPDAPAGRWLLLAAGSGITPLMSLTRAWAARPSGQLTLVYWARHRAELCYLRELRELAAKHPDFHLHVAVTREALRMGDELGERLSAELLQRLVPALDEQQVYACGPAGFVEQARGLMAARARHFHGEAFTPPPMIPIEATGSVRVELRASGRSLEVPRGQALLPALEAQGIKPAYGCRMGICNTCACAKLDGTTQDLNTGDHSAERSSALRLCVNRAVSDLVLDL